MSEEPVMRSAPRRVWLWGGVALTIIGLPGLAMLLLQPSVESLIGHAQQSLAAGDLQAARSAAEQVVRRDPGNQIGWTLLATAGFHLQERAVWEPAMAHLDESAAFEVWLELGSEAMRRFQAAPAELALRNASVIRPDRPEPWRLLAQLIAIQGRPRETSECLMALVRQKEFTAADLRLLAWPHAALDESERVREMLAADPRNLIPGLSMVGQAFDTNEAAQAEQILRAILETHPDHPRTNALYGLLLAERDAPEFPGWSRSQADPAMIEPEAWIARGIWLRKHDQLAAAVRCFHQAVMLDPRHLQALTELGQSLVGFGERTLGAEFLAAARHQQVITELSKRIDETVDPEITRQLVDQLDASGRWWEAAAWSRMHLHAYPDDATMLARRQQIEARLTPDFPRVAPEMMPGRDYDWEALPLPNWSATKATGAGEESNGPVLAFHDDAARLGLDFRFVNGLVDRRTVVQTSGGGVAAIDYDRDGWCDLYFTQGGSDPTAATQTEVDALYRNQGGVAYSNIAAQAGLHEDRFSQGVAVGDIDNDGFPDLLVANLGQNRLYHNNGDGTFTDITVTAGLKTTGWTTSVAIADFNRDGFPELFSVRYVGGPDIHTRVCRDPSGQPGVCRPTVFEAETDVLALSLGDGRFEEQIAEAGLDLPDGRGFGLIVAHFDKDDLLDVFVANDLTGNFLLRQQAGVAPRVRFAEEALLAGVAFDRDGFPQACMGVAASDLNRDGLPDLFITNFARESATLYLSQPYGGYSDETRSAALRDPTFHPLGFGTQFLDADRDGRQDLLVLNGHLYDTSALGIAQAMLPQLFRGLPDGRFQPVVSSDPEDFFRRPRIGRGLCTLDWNRDGLADFAGSFLDGQAALGTNATVTAGHWLKLELAGVASNRDGIGARVEARLPDGTQSDWQATAGDGFAAANEHGWQMGLGGHTEVERLTIRWPSGHTDHWSNVPANQRWLAIEGRPALVAAP